MSTAEGNIRAKQNGIEMENWVKAFYPNAVFDYKGAIDCTIEGIKAEVKSCQDLVTDKKYKHGLRAGRICFNSFQHEILLQEGGDYIVLVQKEGVPFLFYRFPAHIINLGTWEGNKCISWKELLFGGYLL